MAELLDVTYVTLWDGSTEIKTRAKYNPETKQVTDIQSVEGVDADGDEVQTLEREYIILPNEEELEVYEENGEYMTD